MNNAGPHGFSEVLYAFTSVCRQQRIRVRRAVGQHDVLQRVALAFGMLIGRFFVIVPALAIAGSLAAKKTVPASVGTFPTTGALFVGLLVGVILIVGGLTFFPALALGSDRRAPRDRRRSDVLAAPRTPLLPSGREKD